MLSFTTKQAPISWTDQGGGKPLERPTWAICFLVQSVVAVTGPPHDAVRTQTGRMGDKAKPPGLRDTGGFAVSDQDQCDVVDPVQLT